MKNYVICIFARFIYVLLLVICSFVHYFDYRLFYLNNDLKTLQLLVLNKYLGNYYSKGHSWLTFILI